MFQHTGVKHHSAMAAGKCFIRFVDRSVNLARRDKDSLPRLKKKRTVFHLKFHCALFQIKDFGFGVAVRIKSAGLSLSHHSAVEAIHGIFFCFQTWETSCSFDKYTTKSRIVQVSHTIMQDFRKEYWYNFHIN